MDSPDQAHDTSNSSSSESPPPPPPPPPPLPPHPFPQQEDPIFNELDLSPIRQPAKTTYDMAQEFELGSQPHADDLGKGSFPLLPPRIPEYSLSLAPSSAYLRASHMPLDIAATSSSSKGKMPEVFHQTKPGEKRKRKSITTEDECKQCTCQGECTEPACECYAAGYYCADPCSCLGCINKPEYENAIREFARQFESRGPITLTPEIVQLAPHIPSNNMQDVNPTTQTTSPRPKRGCSCQKRMCQDSICGCNKLTIGCSPRCLCRGCKNPYGKRQELVPHYHIPPSSKIQSSDQGKNLRMGGLSTASITPEAMPRNPDPHKMVDWREIVPPPPPAGGSGSSLAGGSTLPRHSSSIQPGATMTGSLGEQPLNIVEDEAHDFFMEDSTPLSFVKATSSSNPCIDYKGSDDDEDSERTASE